MVMAPSRCRKLSLFAYVPTGVLGPEAKQVNNHSVQRHHSSMSKVILKTCLTSTDLLPACGLKRGSQPRRKIKWLHERFWIHLLKEADCLLGSMKAFYKLQRVKSPGWKIWFHLECKSPANWRSGARKSGHLLYSPFSWGPRECGKRVLKDSKHTCPENE